MLDAAGRLGKIVVGMNKALGDIPVTVKLRTGVKDGRNTAHKLMPRLGSEWGVGAVTVCGLSYGDTPTTFLTLSLFEAPWPDTATALHKACRLGLCQTVCRRRPRARG